MSEPPVLFSSTGGVARITLNRPDRLNAFTAELHAELRRALDRVEGDPECRVLVLAGAGRAFCAGQDLHERVRPADAPPVDLGETLGRDLNPTVVRIHELPIPVVAAVNGTAAGAGASLALASDLVVAARSARFSFGFCRIGLVPDGGASWVLPRLVGRARATGLALLGEAIAADEAVAAGLIWKAVDDADLSGEVDRLSGFLRRQSRGALAATKQALRAAWVNSLTDQLELERLTQQARGMSPDYREGLAAFLEKRKPRFEGLE